ncbi:MAG: phosphoribosylamine--glycine ligase [Candidatus Doudnabacteria bacterium RIFCSPHIGHO2_02_FULL_48_21]|nr:MAG: phosphoribosylamine--glycine ligase [Candidatus Doudnabacteria bacterium RIFCSPHIGHO2_01_48_18]OGE78907.1 MAG: phosphoribosylamine--glycine ligase [Candidatus Doudnabacteria bacterium RIFCSPHIGHO2_01_FULL_48_180]OGE90946.1 MAG: phosphoribosylamine--glycine ligase [Candidatus Doudnabacteria bacterium RIFCSPHIGHO2_12_FULL_47_25]OGE94182.1 MAG: phosphoribosylamine--glycine ligase [Candidatus Doudnabacteria bacterium RIFCSPHIGHO2_02_FULL_48_21]OGE98159.1 MAG: phosphoribosylamine--glycine li
MELLVIGKGGREAAIAKRAASEGATVYIAPGNAGMKAWGELVNIKEDDLESLRKFAESTNIDVTFVGPEAPLIAGIVDEFESAGLRIVGCKKYAADHTEGSKIATQMLQDYGINIAPGAWFDTSELAMKYIDRHPEMLVVKADELALGKGVTVGKDQEHAKAAVQSFMIDRIFGPKIGNKIVIQKRLTGWEVSFHVLIGKDGYKILCTVQDYKKAPNGENGGGQGARTIAIPEWVVQKFRKNILEPTLAAFRDMGIEYFGILYAGCMVVPGERDVYLLEYNCRMGDPETQIICAKLKSPLLPVLRGLASKRVTDLKLEYHDEEVVLVVGCSHGYPGNVPDSAKNHPITNWDAFDPHEQAVYVLPAGIGLHNGQIVNTGGRVLNFIAKAKSKEQAAKLAYDLSNEIRFKGMWVQPGIGTD